MTTLQSLQEEIAPHKGQLVLDHFKIVLLKDVVEETDDFYYVYYDLARGKYLSSCVMGWIPLKGFIPDKHYNRLVGIWNYNVYEPDKAI